MATINGGTGFISAGKMFHAASASRILCPRMPSPFRIILSLSTRRVTAVEAGLLLWLPFARPYFKIAVGARCTCSPTSSWYARLIGESCSSSKIWCAVVNYCCCSRKEDSDAGDMFATVYRLMCELAVAYHGHVKIYVRSYISLCAELYFALGGIAL